MLTFFVAAIFILCAALNKLSQRDNERSTFSRFWRRPSRTVTIAFAIAGSVVSFALERKGIRWKYSETAFGTIMLVWLLLSGFRPEWRKARYWVALAFITALHLLLWLFLASRVERFGLGLMFVLLVAELALGATLLAKVMPEDETTMLDYLQRW